MSDSASPTVDQLQSEITQLLQALRNAETALHTQMAGKQQQLAAPQLQTGGVNLGQDNVIGQMGDAVAGDKISGDQVLRDKIVNNFFGGAPGESGEALLGAYIGW